MSEKPLAVKEFVIKNADKSYLSDAKLSMYNSSSFDYGNGHCLVLDVDGTANAFDARYDNRFHSVDSFNEFAHEFVRENIRSEFIVEDK